MIEEAIYLEEVIVIGAADALNPRAAAAARFAAQEASGTVAVASR